MNDQTRYRYEQRIKSLQEALTKAENERRLYKNVVSDVHNGILDAMDKDSRVINPVWILRQTRILWR